MLRAPETEVVSTHSSATVLYQAEETPYTLVKVTSEGISDGQRVRETDVPRRVHRMRETSQEEALASTRHFFASGNGQGQVVSLELPEEVSTTTASGIPLEISPPAITSTVPTIYTTITTTGAGKEVLDPFFLMHHLLGTPQWLLVDHRHGYREFQKDGLTSFPWMVLNWE